MLTESQQQQFWRDGYLVVPNLFTPNAITALQQTFTQWVSESKHYSSAYGETLDGRPRFDVDSDHSATHPSLRRVSSPTEIADCYYAAAFHSAMSDAVTQLIGPNVRFHHSKINAKLPGTRTQVKWHQDFLFTPHTNDSLITALLMVSEVTPENGPLTVIPGSHNGPLYPHWQGDVFSGSIDNDIVDKQCQTPHSCYGPAGSVCFMHTRLLHASAPNATALPRILYIVVYSAEDAYPLADNPLPSKHERQMVCGEESHAIRCTTNHFLLPRKPSGASFFVQQEGLD
ncbi:phytanoyl-CoA dioxygenase family protein [Rosenbergiella australiborealis]|uniref:phytanoyl-CoA dioxygenase family protein n=1 Tax=Rosenbergiella australiborealis TaxID=1544696 RepID=UPI001F4E7602|nr:phytanoyl-CoA dioxygenase family protein [Rosenbergiella australiborealis]